MANVNGTGGPRRLAGPLIATQRIHHWITQHPGCTREEIEAATLERGMVDVGHARRSYAHYLNRMRRRIRHGTLATGTARVPHGSRTPRATATPASVADRTDQVIRWMVQRILSNMQTHQSVACVDGRYTVLRKLKATGTLSMKEILSDPAHTSYELKRAEAMRAFRLEWAQFTAPHGRLTWKARRAIIPWLRLELRLAPDATGSEPAATAPETP